MPLPRSGRRKLWYRTTWVPDHLGTGHRFRITRLFGSFVICDSGLWARNVAVFLQFRFKGNKAKWGGAARMSDIASATFTDCTFLSNTATDKGGAIVVQIEKPHEHT